ncbi:hypothetical protein STEG23_024056, partial [Scotinomys teguina]
MSLHCTALLRVYTVRRCYESTLYGTVMSLHCTALCHLSHVTSTVTSMCQELVSKDCTSGKTCQIPWLLFVTEFSLINNVVPSDQWSQYQAIMMPFPMLTGRAPPQDLSRHAVLLICLEQKMPFDLSFSGNDFGSWSAIPDPSCLQQLLSYFSTLSASYLLASDIWRNCDVKLLKMLLAFRPVFTAQLGSQLHLHDVLFFKGIFHFLFKGLYHLLKVIFSDEFCFFCV